MIPAEAVEAAAWALYERDHIKGVALGDVRRALEAAAPYIRAQALEDAASNIDQWIKAGADEPVHPYETSKWLRNRADNLLNTEGEK